MEGQAGPRAASFLTQISEPLFQAGKRSSGVLPYALTSRDVQGVFSGPVYHTLNMYDHQRPPRCPESEILGPQTLGPRPLNPRTPKP